MSSTNQLFEGIGAPVNVAQTEDQYIDPTLDSCCQREVCFVTYDMIIFYIHTFMILSHPNTMIMILVYRLNQIVNKMQ